MVILITGFCKMGFLKSCVVCEVALVCHKDTALHQAGALRRCLKTSVNGEGRSATTRGRIVWGF